MLSSKRMVEFKMNDVGDGWWRLVRRHPCQCSDLFLRADAAKRLGASRRNIAKLPTLLE
jgi:hypothetical protein